MLIGENVAAAPRATRRPANPAPPRPRVPAQRIDYASLLCLTAIVASVVLSYGGMSRPEFDLSLASLGLFAWSFVALRTADLFERRGAGEEMP